MFNVKDQDVWRNRGVLTKSTYDTHANGFHCCSKPSFQTYCYVNTIPYIR
jgi:hypothetical protein